MKPKNLAIGVAIIAVIAVVLKFTSGPADDSGSKTERQQVKGRMLITKENAKILDTTHRIEIVSKNTLFLNDDDKFRSDLSNYVLAEDAKKDDEVVAKAGTKLDADTVAKLREKEVSSVETTETLILEQGAASWLIKTLFGLPAEDPFDTENGFVKDILKAKIIRSAGKAEKVAEKHETDQTTVTFKNKEGITLWQFAPGKRHDSGGRYASVAGEEYAYHVQSERDKDNDNFSWLNIDDENSDWVEKNLLEHLEEDNEIEKVELTYPTLPPVIEKITFTRNDGKWTTEHSIPNKDFDDSTVTKLVDAITDVRWNDALALESENVTKAKGHYRKLIVHTKSLGNYQVQVGRSPAPPKEAKKEDDKKEEEKEEKEEEEPEPGPVVTFMESLEVSSPLFKLAEKTAFDAGESLYDAIPETTAGFFKDPPPPPPPPPVPTSATGGVSVSGGVKATPKKPKISVATPPIAVPPVPPPPPTEIPPPPPNIPPPTQPPVKNDK